MRGNLRLFGNQSDVHVANAIAALVGFVNGAAEDVLRVHAFARWIIIREKVSDVGQTKRAEDGVRQRMRQAICVRMAIEPFIVRDIDAAQHETAGGREAVNVVTKTDAKREAHCAYC
ncbi:hypothetical protein GCM10007047_09520 [Cerasicoccus arenae]|uniref:Uncharacterized protein n=1 Tax=Cerasicoccus arenae TaxID=424488 RepID=A0A8J3DE46_9BACT|nr:hypothetical protein GCM10007047_09520 [Cerasicoccus arenae]